MVCKRALIVSSALLLLAGLNACGSNNPMKLTAPKPQQQGLTTDPSVFNFEAGVQGWVPNNPGGGCTACTVTWVGTGEGQTEVGPSYLGTGAIKYHIVYNAAYSNFQVHVLNPGSITVGSFISYSIFIPPAARAGINGIHPFYNDQVGYFDYYFNDNMIPDDGWVRAYVQINSATQNPLTAIGVGFDIPSTYEGDIYIDSVDFP